MGQEITQSSFDEQDFAEFRRRLVAETKLLQQWMDDGLLEAEEPMAGSEIEAWLVDDQGQPAAVNRAFLADIDDPMVVPELSTFNVELNTRPRHYGAGMFEEMHTELASLWQRCEDTALLHRAHMLMIGILPTIRQSALCLANISSMQRYQALNEQVLKMRDGRPLRIDIQGRQKLLGSHEDVMLEAATTSLQLHLKISARDAAKAYNLSKIISAPMVALSANSPYLFGYDLWDETRIPVFEQSVAVGASDYSKRVTFGIRYAEHSLMECFMANRDRYPVLMPQLMDEPVEQLAHLRLHNGTIWRWNRPLVGFDDDGRPHLRVEHRVAPSGPSTLDVIANSAFYFGLVTEYMATEQAPEKRLPFLLVKKDFYHCARSGLDARVTWLDGQTASVADLILQQLLPAAQQGLARMGVSATEAEYWLGIIRDRVATGQTGACWQRTWVEAHGKDFSGLVQSYLANQLAGRPVHQWTV